jgi:hypothetical protein
LRAWLKRLDAAGVALKPRYRWIGWTDDGALRFETPAVARFSRRLFSRSVPIPIEKQEDRLG